MIITRKFVLAAFASLASTGLCWFMHISGGEWVAAQGLILSVHGITNIVDKHIGGAG